MIGKKWVLKTVDGELPTNDDIEQLRRWLTHDDSRPVMYTKIQRKEGSSEITSCEIHFDATDGRRTLAVASSELAQVKAFGLKQAEFIEAVKAAAESKNWNSVLEMYGIEEG